MSLQPGVKAPTHDTQVDWVPEETGGFILPKCVIVTVLEEVCPFLQTQRPYCSGGRPTQLHGGDEGGRAMGQNTGFPPRD